MQQQKHDDVTEEELPHNTDSCVEFDPDCGECVKQRLEADAATVPLSVVEVQKSFLLLYHTSCTLVMRAEPSSHFNDIVYSFSFSLISFFVSCTVLS
jgi:hypothetical protein